jgi:hypothetical protein
MQREGKAEVAAETVTLRRRDDCLDELSVPKIDLLKIMWRVWNERFWKGPPASCG